MAIYLGFGSNLGDRRANLSLALRRLGPEVVVEAVSPLYESAPQPPAPPPDYLNAACRVTTTLAPRAVLDYLKRIERAMGRTPAERWAPRLIDLDILLFDDLVIATDTLTVPHARIGERAFVLKPLLDLDPDLVLPGSGERLDSLLAHVEGDAELVAPAGWDIEAGGQD